MATAKAQAQGAKKKQVVSKKPKEVASSSSSSDEESDFDDEEDPDSIQVPGGGKDLKTLSQIGSADARPSPTPPPSDPSGLGLILPSKPVVLNTPRPQPSVQTGYEVIRIAPGASPFGTVGVRQNSSVMQQAIALVKNNVPGGPPIRVNLPLAAVQSLLRNRSPQVQVNVHFIFLSIGDTSTQFNRLSELSS